MHGNGTLSKPNGYVYKGGFQYGKQSGCGKATYPDGKDYDGQWRNEKYHGHGMLRTANGYIYTGDFQYGKQSGRGKAVYPDGKVYVGEWRNGKHHGQGTLSSPNGYKYIGYFQYGKQSGLGKAIYPHGDVYDGEWRNEKHHGQGIYSWPNGDSYDGKWHRGMKNGQGTFKSVDGQSRGQYKDDKKEGFWTFTPSGDMDRYDNGKLLEASPKLVDGYLHQNERAYKNLNFPDDLYRLFKDYAVHESKPKSV